MSRTVLLLGASGFIGSAVGHALHADRHTVRAVGRDLAYGQRVLPCAKWVCCDLRRMTRAASWEPLLQGVEIVVNASGALQSGLRDDVAVAQAAAILALIEASKRAGVRHFVQVSAAGAEAQASDFMQSKARADAALVASSLPYTILRPGLVVGRNGFGGTELLRAAAGVALVQFEVVGTGPIQCVALADVVEAVRHAVANPAKATGSFDLVEAQPRSLNEIVTLHRRWLGLRPPRFAPRLPLAWLKPLTWLADALGWLGWRSPLRRNAILALVHGVRGDAAQARKLLAREPLSLPETLAALGPAGKADRWHARLAHLYPLALASLVLLWLASGGLGLARQDESMALLVMGGVSENAARALVLGGSLADLAIAAGLVFRPALRIVLLASVLLALGYGLGAALVRPDLWLDPLAPMLKVIPIVVLSLMSLAMAEER